MLNHYSIAMIVPKAGLTETQLAHAIARLKWTQSQLVAATKINVHVPAFALGAGDEIERSVPPEVRNLRRYYLEMHFHGYDDHSAGNASLICAAAERMWCCDEVWCFPAEKNNHKARVAQVWSCGQMGTQATKYKMFPWWLPMPASKEAPPKQAKGAPRKWPSNKWN